MANVYKTTVGLVLVGLLAVVGCHDLQHALTSSQPVPAPLQREPFVTAADIPHDKTYDEAVGGGHLFDRHCATCHNPRPLAERPFFSYAPIVTHMRTVANLTGEEQRKIMVFLEKWHGMPPPHPPTEPTPKRFFYSQPIPELRQQQPKTLPDLPAGPRPGLSDAAGPGPCPPGEVPHEAH